MFTHLSRAPFVREQNRLKDAKMKGALTVAFAAASVEGRMQRGYGNVCLTDRACSDKLYSDKPGSGQISSCQLRNSIPGPGGASREARTGAARTLRCAGMGDGLPRSG